MNLINTILTNGFILVIPILIWNVVFSSKLPTMYRLDYFNRDIPKFILFFENIFRTIIFTLPFFLKCSYFTSRGIFGLSIYVLGSFIYYSSWIFLIYFPNTVLSKSIFGHIAPSYTPIIFLIGISLMQHTYYFGVTYSIWQYILPSILFSLFHIPHAILKFKQFEIV